MSYQKAQFEDKRAPLHSEFGQDFLIRRFGPTVAQEILTTLPLYKSGPHRGLRKGWIQWMKVAVGGWTRQLPTTPSSGVVRPGTSFVRVTIEFDRSSGAFYERGHHPENCTEQELCERWHVALERMLDTAKTGADRRYS